MKKIYTLLVLSFFIIGKNEAQVPSARPNIVLVIGDDMRYDSFGPTGGPDWFNIPSINRIATEGAFFKNYFCVYSLCIPSRSTMMTGLYPHSSGAIDNEHTYDPGLPTIAAILDSVGYHTAMIGKYDAYNTPQPGWDYWMAEASSTTYSNPKFNINGYTKTLFGNTTQIIIDSSDKILSTIDTPFFMIIAHQAPHKKVVPLPADEGMYASEQMPFPPNFFPYTDLYPSFLDDHAQYHDSAGLEIDLENYYEGIQGIETNVTAVFDVLTTRNLLNNTMMLFTADNGYLYGEHLLVGKGLPLEPSIKLPMFIRYPAWFAANTVVTDPMVLQTDVAPSIVEAAGINPAPYHFQGFSMHKLAKGHEKRDMILYENIKYATQEDPITPSLRTLRTAHYKYNRYQCTEKTEEFFDLDNDPGENSNLILDTTYATLIAQYREQLDSLRLVYNDTLSGDTVVRPCYLVGSGKQSAVSYVIDPPYLFLKTSPNPFGDQLDIKIIAEQKLPLDVAIYNQMGGRIFSQQLNPSAGTAIITFRDKTLPPGIYLVHIQQGRNSTHQYVYKE